MRYLLKNILTHTDMLGSISLGRLLGLKRGAEMSWGKRGLGWNKINFCGNKVDLSSYCMEDLIRVVMFQISSILTKFNPLEDSVVFKVVIFRI